MGTVIQVQNSIELLSALEIATGGDTILLAAGEYGSLALNADVHSYAKFDDTLTIKSADPDDPAVFDTIFMRGAENVTFDSIKVDYDFSTGDPDWIAPFRILGESSNITITNSIFDGDVASGVSAIDDGYGTGRGLTVVDSDNITVSNNEFYNWFHAAQFTRVDDLVVSGNDVHSIRSDGFDFTAIGGALIEQNHFHDFIAAPLSDDHRDMIQFWTTNSTTPTTDIVIRENIFNSGTGAYTQSIFIRNEKVDWGQAGSELFYSNLTIEDNVIHNAHLHGITVGQTNGLTITNNTLLHNSDTGDEGAVSVPKINVNEDSLNVTVTNNIIPVAFTSNGEGWIVGNNLIVQKSDQDAANYIGDLFVNALAGSGATQSDLLAVKDGIIEQLGVGSVLTLFESGAGSHVGFVSDVAGTGLNLLNYAFDAQNIFDSQGKSDLTGSQVDWDFGDGTTGQGVNASHSYAQAGTYGVQALVTLADGSQVILRKTIEAQTPIALKTDFDTGAQDSSDVVNAVTVDSAVTFEQTATGEAARLNNGVLTYARGEELRGNSEYTVLFDFKKDAGNEAASGTAIYFTASFIFTVQSNGLNVAVITDQGTQTLNVSNLGINDADWHRVAFTFSGKEGLAKLYLDGNEVGRIDGLDGAVQTGSSSHDFYVGSPYGPSFDGLIDNVGFLRGAIAAQDANAGLAALTSGNVQGDGSGVTIPDPVVIDPVVIDPVVIDPVVIDPVTTDPVLIDPVTTDPVTTNPGTTDPVASDPGTTGPTSADSNTTKTTGRDKFNKHDPIRGTKNKDKLSGTDDSDLLLGYDGTDSISGKGGDDALIGGDDGDSLLGGSGNDLLDGEAGSDALRGQTGDDILYGGNRADLLYGGSGNDELYGGRGSDELYGRQGDDYLSGNKGTDLLKGSSGNDVLVGGFGNDTLYGGSGNDEFVYGAEVNSRDKIYDFTAGEDTITLRGLTGITIENVLDTAVEIAGDTVLTFDAKGENEVTLIGVSKDELSEANFSLVS